MQPIQREHWFPYPLETTYTTLTDVTKFAKIVKRIDSLKVLERTGQNGRVAAVIDLPGGKLVQTEGAVAGEDNEYLEFRTEKPFPMVIRWDLVGQTRDVVNGTSVTYSVAIDLSPVLAFLPAKILDGFLSTEMEGDLDRLLEILQTEN